MSKVLIIGAGGVGQVVAGKCAQMPEVFSEICLASRTVSKCEAIAQRFDREIETAGVEANDPANVVALIERTQPAIVINVAQPYQNLPIMEACAQTGVHYVDTSMYDEPDIFATDYEPQLKFAERYAPKNVTGVLSIGFDPGVVNVFCAYAQKHHFDEIDHIDIIDCNDGDHGLPFATNFDPETNIREILADACFYEDGEMKSAEALTVKQDFDFPEVGTRTGYLMFHEEVISLATNIKGVKSVRFWMTFGEAYLRHLNVLRNVGLAGTEPIEYQGKQIVPLQFLKAVLPEPSSLGPRYTGYTCIATIIEGRKDGQSKKIIIYNLCDHKAAYEEVGVQAISYTTGVPAITAAQQVLSGAWQQPGVFCPEELDPDPFLADLAKNGLPWHVKEL
ncbi:MAG: saccharopine dehydrogenase C-terminal domain-containing protein [Limisphaerales bacterium]